MKVTILATELGADVKNLDIRFKYLTTYDPCNVCKRDIISRAIIYPKATFDVRRPVFFDDVSKRKIPVGGNDDYIKFINQNNI